MILNESQQIQPFPQLYCSIHPTEPITDFCGSENCHHRVLCPTCKEAHHSLKQLISSQDLENKKIFSALEKLGQEEGADSPENILQELENTFASMKQELDKAFEAVKTRAFEIAQSKLSRTKSWKTMNSELQEKYNAIFSQPLTPRGRVLEDFTKDYCSIVKQLEKKEKEPKVIIRPAKNEFVKMMTGLKDTLTKHQDKLVHVEYQNSIVKSKVNLKNIKKEKIVSLDYQTGIKPTAITYLENQDLIATSGGTDITLWSAKTFTKVQTRPDVHTSKVISLAYSPKKNTLFSCAWDRTIRLFLINSQGFRGLAKVITVPPGSSASGIFVLEEKGIFLTYGQGQNIRIWGLNDNKLKGIISTDGMTDMGPNMAYSKKNNMLAVFFHRTGKIGLVSLDTRQVLEVLDTKMKQNDIFSQALLFNEKKGILLASSDFGKLRIWTIRNRKPTISKDIDVKGYCFGMVGFEEEDTVVLVNFLKDLVLVNVHSGMVVQTNALGVRNGSSLVHLANHRKFIVSDSLTDKVCVLNY